VAAPHSDGPIKQAQVIVLYLTNAVTRRHLEAHHPEAAGEIRKLEGIINETALDADLLSLCTVYFDTALAGETWEPPESLSELERACIDVCEQFMISVSDVREEQIAALRRHLSTDDVYNLMSAIYLIEMSRRLDLTLERVLP
jgi:hypothetical protein